MANAGSISNCKYRDGAPVLYLSRYDARRRAREGTPASGRRMPTGSNLVQIVMVRPSLDVALSAARSNWVRLTQFSSFILLSVPFLFAPPSAASDTGTSKYIAS